MTMSQRQSSRALRLGQCRWLFFLGPCRPFVRRQEWCGSGERASSLVSWPIVAVGRPRISVMIQVHGACFDNGAFSTLSATNPRGVVLSGPRLFAQCFYQSGGLVVACLWSFLERPNTRVKLAAPFFSGGRLFVNIQVSRRSLRAFR